jgi:hypothetical protein
VTETITEQAAHETVAVVSGMIEVLSAGTLRIESKDDELLFGKRYVAAERIGARASSKLDEGMRVVGIGGKPARLKSKKSRKKKRHAHSARTAGSNAPGKVLSKITAQR